DRPARGSEVFEFSGLYRAPAGFSPESGTPHFGYNSATAKVAELVDALDLGSSAERHVGSSPSFRTRSRFTAFSGTASRKSRDTQQGKFDAAGSPEHSQPPRAAPHRFRAGRADRG